MKPIRHAPLLAPSLRGGLILAAVLATLVVAQPVPPWIELPPSAAGAVLRNTLAWLFGALALPMIAGLAVALCLGHLEQRMAKANPGVDTQRAPGASSAVGVFLLALVVPGLLIAELLVAVYARPGAAVEGLLSFATLAAACAAGAAVVVGVGVTARRWERRLVEREREKPTERAATRRRAAGR